MGRHGSTSPYELNGQIIYLTTSWYVKTDAYETALEMRENMINLKGEMLLGSDWTLACDLGRGESRSIILDKKQKISPTAFSLNYESRWIGVQDGSLVSIKDVMELRTLTKAELKDYRDSEYIISVDVARSQNESNNQCSVCVLKIKRNNRGKIVAVQLVNMINISSIMNFKVQAQDIMRIKNRYNAKAVVCDGNGLGIGLVDNLTLEQIDPLTGESLGCYKTINTDQESENEDAEECLYVLKSQSINTDIIVNFIDNVESGKLQLLEKRMDAGYDLNDEGHIEQEVAPFVQTDLLLEEIANLKMKTMNNGKLAIERQTRKLDDDRFYSLAYGLYYIYEYENDLDIDIKSDMSDYLLIN